MSNMLSGGETTTLEVVVPTDYYMEELYSYFEGSKIDSDLTMVKIRNVDDVFLNCMTVDEFVEFIGIDSEFVVSTNWNELM